MPSLLLLSGPRAGTQFPISGDRYILGRSTGCDLVLDATIHIVPDKQRAGVSRRQALITCVGEEWYIEDGDGKSASHNGTLLNGKRLPFPGRHPLRDQDQIRVCDIRLTFLCEPESTFTLEATLNRSDSGLSLDNQSPDRLRVLLDIGADLTGTFDADVLVDRTLEHLSRLFRQADRALVVFRDPTTGALAPRAVRMAGGAAPDTSFSTTVIRRCVEGAEAILGNDLANQFPESDSLGGGEARSLVCAPLWSREGKTLGAIQLETRRMAQRFTAHDLHLLLAVAGQASLGLSNVQLHAELLQAQRRTRDLELARQVQIALLPHGLPVLPGYTFFAYYEAAEQVGGDYYDFIPLPDGKLAVLLGDVSGHGAAAALLMAKFGVEARVCLESSANPAEAVMRLNAVMMRAAIADTFVTFVAAVIDPIAHTLAVVNAGHPSPLVRRTAIGAVEDATPEESFGTPVGVCDHFDYQTRVINLNPGDGVVIFSDGLTDATDTAGRRFGEEGIRTVLRAAPPGHRATGAALVAAVKHHSAGADQGDDIALLVFGRVASE